MKVAEAVKSWGTLSEYVFKLVSGEEKKLLTNDECEMIEKAVDAFAKDMGADEAVAKAKRFMNFNILDKNVNFKIFDRLPNTWSIIYVASMVASESVEV